MPQPNNASLIGALAAAVADAQLPTVPRAHQQLALDVTVADQAAIVRARVVDHDERAALEPRDRDRAGTITRGHDATDRHEADFVQLRAAVLRVVTQDVEDLRVERGHAPRLATGSDSPLARYWRPRSRYWHVPAVQLIPLGHTSTPDVNNGSVQAVPAATVPRTFNVIP